VRKYGKLNPFQDSAGKRDKWEAGVGRGTRPVVRYIRLYGMALYPGLITRIEAVRISRGHHHQEEEPWQ